MNEDERSKAVALATAIEALSGSHAKILAKELRALLEAASIAAAPSHDDLVGEIARLREELRLAKDAARKRGTRRRQKATPPTQDVDPRQTELFTPKGVENRPDVLDGRSDASLSLSGSDHTNQIQRSERRVRPRPGDDVEPVAHDPDTPPVDFIALAERIRPDLPEAVVRFSWRSFATRNRSHECVSAARSHWENWIRNEDRAKAEKRMYTPFTPPAPVVDEPPPAAIDDEDGDELPEVPPAPPSDVQRLGARLGLPPLDRAAVTPQDALEALLRIDREPPEARAMSA